MFCSSGFDTYVSTSVLTNMKRHLEYIVSVPDIFCYYYFAKNNKITNNSANIDARLKRTHLKSIELFKFLIFISHNDIDWLFDVRLHKTFSTLIEVISSKSACASADFQLEHFVSAPKPSSLAF